MYPGVYTFDVFSRWACARALSVFRRATYCPVLPGRRSRPDHRCRRRCRPRRSRDVPGPGHERQPLHASFADRIDGWYSPGAFSAAPAFTYGNLPRTIDARGPGQANWDISLFKTFSVSERFKAQFRAEAINAFNTPLFEAPNNFFGNSNFGKITRQANFPRFIQFGLRFSF